MIIIVGDITGVFRKTRLPSPDFPGVYRQSIRKVQFLALTYAVFFFSHHQRHAQPFF